MGSGIASGESTHSRAALTAICAIASVVSFSFELFFFSIMSTSFKFSVDIIAQRNPFVNQFVLVRLTIYFEILIEIKPAL